MSDIPFEFLSNFIAMVIPLFFVVFMLGKSDARKIILYFCWGIFAGVLAFNINNLLGGSVSQAERMTIAIAPMVEEICKGLPVLLFLNRKKYPRITLLIVFCAMTSGVGFSIQESMYYFTASSREVMDIALLIVRTLTTALMHGMVTAAFGIGLMLLQKQRSMLVPVILGLFALCATIHALFNLLMYTWLAWVSMLMPIVMFFAGWVFIRNTEYSENQINLGENE